MQNVDESQPKNIFVCAQLVFCVRYNPMTNIIRFNSNGKQLFVWLPILNNNLPAVAFIDNLPSFAATEVSITATGG